MYWHIHFKILFTHLLKAVKTHRLISLRFLLRCCSAQGLFILSELQAIYDLDWALCTPSCSYEQFHSPAAILSHFLGQSQNWVLVEANGCVLSYRCFRKTYPYLLPLPLDRSWQCLLTKLLKLVRRVHFLPSPDCQGWAHKSWEAFDSLR